MASTIFWLLTDAPDNITGQVFHLDGGMSNVRELDEVERRDQNLKAQVGKPRMATIGLKTLMIVEYEGDYPATEGLCRHMRWPLGAGGR